MISLIRSNPAPLLSTPYTQDWPSIGWQGAASSGSDSEMDLTKPLQPIAAFMKDRERMLDEALRAVKGRNLASLIPAPLQVSPSPSLCLS